jgi:hypothetical protein
LSTHFDSTPPKTNTLAIVALISSFFIGLVGIICGAIALKQAKQTGEKGRGLAIGGIVVGALNIVAYVLIVVVVSAASVATVAAASDLADRGAEISSSASADCTELLSVVEDSSSALQDVSLLGTDPAKAMTALHAFSADFHEAADAVSDRKVKAAADDATGKLDAFIAYLEPIAADPAAAGDEVDDAQAKAQEFIVSMQSIGTACSQ